LTPQAGFPLKDAVVSLNLADGSSLRGKLDWSTTLQDALVQDHVVGSLRKEKLNVGQLVGEAIPTAVHTMGADFDVRLRDHGVLESVRVVLAVAYASRGNEQARAGHLNTVVANAQAVEWWCVFPLAAIDVALALGKNHLEASVALGA